MNRFVIYFFIIFICLSCCFSCQSEPGLEAREIPFNANIRCVKHSIDQNSILIGMENGIIVRKDLVNDVSDTIHAESRVYDIVEQKHAEPDWSRYWVGARNIGLLEIIYNHKERRTEKKKAYPIPVKGIRYSPYSIEAIGDNLYVGTSSGLYRKKNDQSDLELINSYFINKIVFSPKDSSLFLATNRGVYRYYIVSEVMDTIKKLSHIKSEIKTIHLNPDNTLDIIDGNTHFTYDIAANTVKTVRDFSSENVDLVDCMHTSDALWYVTNRKIICKKGDEEFSYLHTGNVTRNNSLIVLDFLMVPCLDKLLYFPLHDMVVREKDDIMAVSNRLDHTVYFITRDFILYSYQDGYKSKRIKKIEAIPEEINRMQITKNYIWLSSSKNVYRFDKNGRNKLVVKEIKDSPSMNNRKEGINTFCCITSADALETGLYVGLRNRLLYSGMDKIREDTPFDTVKLETDYEKNNDLFINNILPKGDSVYILTLNQGLYCGQLHSVEHFEHVEGACSDSIGNPTSFVEAKQNGINQLIILSNQGLFEYDMHKKTIENKQYPDVNQIKALMSGDENNIYLLGHRGIKKYPDEVDFRFNDIAFETASISPNINSIVYASKTGLYKLDYNTMNFNSIQLENRSEVSIFLFCFLAFILIGSGWLGFTYLKKQRIKRKTGRQNFQEQVLQITALNKQLEREIQLRETLQKQLQEAQHSSLELSAGFSENSIWEIRSGLNNLINELHIKGRNLMLKNKLEYLFEICFREDALFREVIRMPEKRQVTMLALVRYFKSNEVNQMLRLNIADATIDSWRSSIREELREVLRKEDCKHKGIKQILLENLSGKK